MPLVLITLMFLLLVAGIVIAFVINSRQKQQMKFELTATKLEYEKELRQVDHEVREAMLNQFAREVHDNLGHALTCSRLELEKFKLDYPELAQAILDIDNSLSNASNQARQLSHTLNGDMIFKLSLSEAISQEIERHSNLNKNNVFLQNHYYSEVLENNERLMAYRIFQELLTNAIRHSKSSEIQVCIHSDPAFKMEFKDDGKGFDYAEALNGKTSSGLMNIERRAEMAGFEFKPNTHVGEGSKFTLEKINTVTS